NVYRWEANAPVTYTDPSGLTVAPLPVVGRPWTEEDSELWRQAMRAITASQPKPVERFRGGFRLETEDEVNERLYAGGTLTAEDLNPAMGTVVLDGLEGMGQAVAAAAIA